jgi:thiamine biosynthesis protein ThiI
MKFIVKLQSEITIKSRPVRKRFTKILESNLKTVLRRVDPQVHVRMTWDNIEVNTPNDEPENREKVIATLKCVPGIPMFLEVVQTDFTDMHSIYEKTVALHAKSIENKTFCVRVKRTGTHDFKSIQVEQYVGGGLNQAVESAKV